MKFHLEFLKNRKPVTADPNWNSQLTSEDFIRMFPERAARLGMIPMRTTIEEIPLQPGPNPAQAELAD
jgi:hypothetical protein